MEVPSKGRTIAEQDLHDLRLTIPARKNWFILIFLTVWLGGWLIGEFFAIGTLFTNGSDGISLFLLFWLAGWSIGGIFAFQILVWNLRGKEIITIGSGRLSIAKKGTIFGKEKVYDLREVKRLRVQDDASVFNTVFGQRRNTLGPFNSGGMLRFDYGMKTIRFAADIDEAEAEALLSKLAGRYPAISDKGT
jgi:hypothetical protein